MIRKTCLVAIFALSAGLTLAGVAPAQTQTSSAAAPADVAQPAAAAPTQSTLWVPKTPAFKPWDPNSGQPTYSPTPPPGSSGIYLPAAVLGYARSAAGCVVIGCDEGPQVGGSSGPSSSGATEPQPVKPGPFDPH